MSAPTRSKRPWCRAGLGQHGAAEHQDADADRHVDEQHPAPGDPLGEHASGDQADGAAADGDRGVEPERADPLAALREHGGQQGECGRRGERAAEPWAARAASRNPPDVAKKALAAELLVRYRHGVRAVQAVPRRDLRRGRTSPGAGPGSRAVRPDVTFSDVVRLVSGILMVRTAEPEQLNRALAVALDGLRYRAAEAR